MILADTNIVSLADLGSNFNLTEEHVFNTTRQEASVGQLRELNPYVKVECFQDKITNFESLRDFSVICITEFLERKLLVNLNDFCRTNNIGFIYAFTGGITGFCFVDFGDNFMIKDENGEECKQYIVRSISNSNPGVVLIDDTLGGKLSWTDGDCVVFREVEGMTEINGQEPVPIKYISPIGFSIGDTSGFKDYKNGGLVEQVKVPKKHEFKSLKEKLDNPYYNNMVPDPIDLAKFGRNELLHVGFLALHEFVSNIKLNSDDGYASLLPRVNNEEDANRVVEIAKNMYNQFKLIDGHWINNSQDFDENIIRSIAMWARCSVSPVTAFAGGVVAQEIIKFTGKYTPISQWLWFDFNETVAKLNTQNRIDNSRYHDQVAIWGSEIQERLANMNLFMIGAGALGCEFLKDFALMGIGTKNGLVTVTDNDNIEVSNLNRQFLFRRDDVGNSKSKCASRAMLKINPDFKSKDLQSRVGPENEHIFDESFWTNQEFIINAVDNVQARKYIDHMCTWHNKPLIDSGTLGTKAHLQIVFPQVTSCYNDTQDPPEDGVPMCTLHNFPAMIEHCIEWGRDHFNGYFTDIIQDAKKFITERNTFYSDLKKEGNTTFQLLKLNMIKDLVNIATSNSFDKCIDLAFNRFVENFDHTIRQLLHNFPPNYTNPDGSNFWSGSKRVPGPLKYNPDDELQFLFVAAYSILIAQALSIKDIRGLDYIREYSSKLEIPSFAAKNIKIKVNDNDNDPNELTLGDDESQLTDLIKEMSLFESTQISDTTFVPHEFEKDDDTNYHIDFINAASNLRARNYTIREADRQKVKMIAGKIIPAIATTTASITGLVALQMLTCMQTDSIDFMRGVYMNLAVNMFVLTEPAPKIVVKDKEYDQVLLGPVKAIPEGWSIWDKIEIRGINTFQELLDHYQKTYNVEVNIITAGRSTLLQTFPKPPKER